MRFLGCLILAASALLANDEFFAAARNGDAAALKTHLDKGVDVNAKWRYDQTALIMAAMHGHLEAVRLLIDRGADVNATESFYKMTPLSAAASENRVEIVKVLLEKGAKGREQVLARSATSDDPAMMKMLLTLQGWDAKDLTTALGAAEANKKDEIVTALKAAGAKPPQEFAIDPATMAKYAGEYAAESGPSVKLEVTNGKLRGGPPGQTFDFRAVELHTFEPAQMPGAFKLVFTLTGDQISGIEVRQGANIQKFTKVVAK